MIFLIILYIIFLLTCISKPCGSSRWSVKTLTDHVINFDNTHFDTLNFVDLYLLDRPVKTFYNTIRMKDEYRIIVVKGILFAYIKESDNDLHVIFSSIYSKDSSIICEIPSPFSCPEVALSPFASNFVETSNYVCSLKSTKEGRWNFFSCKDTVWITGFLFHDFPHHVGQGHMPNFLEIHPVINIERCI